MPENIWRPKPVGSKGFNLGPAESLKKAPAFAGNYKRESDGVTVSIKAPFKYRRTKRVFQVVHDDG